MNAKEVIVIRTLIKESYPYVKMDNEQGDEIWFILFQEYQFKPMYEALINYIKQGNKFAPSAAELIKMHDNFNTLLINDVIAAMDVDGYFDDPEGTAAELAMFNHKNRLRKAVMWIERGLGPDWFIKDYLKYYGNMYPQHIGNNSIKKLERRGDNGA